MPRRRSKSGPLLLIVLAGAAIVGLLAVGASYVIDLRSESARHGEVADVVGTAEKLDEVATQLVNFVEKVEITSTPDPADLADESADLLSDVASVRERLVEVDVAPSEREAIDAVLGRVEGLTRDRLAGRLIAAPTEPVVRDLQTAAEGLINAADARDVTGIASARLAAIELRRVMAARRSDLLAGSGNTTGGRPSGAGDLTELDARNAIFASRLDAVRPLLLTYSDDKDDAGALFDWRLDRALYTDRPVDAGEAAWRDATGDAEDDVLHIVEELDDAAGDDAGALAEDARRNFWTAAILLGSAATLLALAFGLTLVEGRKRRAAEAVLHELATRDQLTGLLNRGQLPEAFAAERQSPDAPLALLYVDVDNFKAVNDARGHSAGDALLVALAERLSASVGGNGKVFRLGGDELLVMRPVREAADVQGICEAVLAAAGAPVTVGGDAVPVSVSVGCTVVTDPNCAIDDALAAADAAMYEAKAQGRGRAVTRPTTAGPPERLDGAQPAV